MKPSNMPLLLLACASLIACNETNPGSSIIPQPTESSETLPPVTETFETAFKAIQGDNLAFFSEVSATQSSLTDSKDTHTAVIGNRQAEFENGKYHLLAYQGKQLVAELSFFKDQEGFAAQQHINLLNEVVTTRLDTGDGKGFAWSQSVYYNLFSELQPSFFVEQENGVYSYDFKTPGYEAWGSYIAASLTGMNTFDPESFTLHYEKGQIKEISLIEKASAEPGSPYSYQRKIVTKIAMQGEVSIPSVSAFPSDPKNAPLASAINELKGATNYTVTTKAYPYTQTGFGTTPAYTEETKVTSTDIVATKIASTGETTYRGHHSHDGGYGSFAGTHDAVTGSASLTETSFLTASLTDLLPKFAFSADIFGHVETKADGTEVYELRDPSLSSVLNEITADSYADSYYGQVKIRLEVKDQHLSTLSFDAAGLENYYLYELSFSNIGSTSIDPAFFAQYGQSTPVSSYADERLCFVFEDPENKTMFGGGITLGFAEFFEIALGAEAANVPFYSSFKPAVDEYYGGVTIDPVDPTKSFCDIACLLGDDSGLPAFIEAIMGGGFVDAVDPTGMYAMYFTKGDLSIGFNEPMAPGEPVAIGFVVPATNFLL